MADPQPINVPAFNATREVRRSTAYNSQSRDYLLNEARRLERARADIEYEISNLKAQSDDISRTIVTLDEAIAKLG